MNILTSILPGFRQLRTPLVCGLLWLAVLYILQAKYHIISRGRTSLMAYSVR
jgi:hypothetical protein